MRLSLNGGRISVPDGVIEVDDYPPLQVGAQFILFAFRNSKTPAFVLKGPALPVGKTTSAPAGHFRVPAELLTGDKATADVLADIKSAAKRCGR